jgi:hypothetical protein
MTTPPNPGTFDDLRGSLPRHQDEVMTGHTGQPTVTEQDRTHGAGLPAVDNGPDDDTKYC